MMFLVGGPWTCNMNIPVATTTCQDQGGKFYSRRNIRFSSKHYVFVPSCKKATGKKITVFVDAF